MHIRLNGMERKRGHRLETWGKGKETQAQSETGNDDDGKMENQRYMSESCPARRPWWRRRIGLLVSPVLFFAARFFGRPVQ